MNRWILGSCFLISLAASSQAAFQEHMWGARPSGMGGAFTALADDSNAPAYNPAGISLLSYNELTIMYAQLYAGLNLHAGEETSKLGLGYFSFIPQIKEKKYGSFGISWSNFSATNLLKEDTFILTYANSYRIEKMETKPIWAYGVNLKYLRRSFEGDARTADDPVFQNGQSANAATVDLGLLFRPNFKILPGLKFGLAGKNLTEPDVGLNGSDRVPANYAFGVAYQDRAFRLLNPAVDISRRNGRTVTTFGWEAWMARDSFAVRAGVNEDELGGGLGYQFQMLDHMLLRLDYSLIMPLDVEETNGNHRISLTTNF